MTLNAPPTIRRADHVGIAVSSLDAAVRFWVEGLGASLERTGERDGAFMEQATGAVCEGARIAIVDLGGQTIELLEYRNPPEPKGPPAAPCDAGAAHLALVVDDLDGVLERIAHHGFTARGPGVPVTSGARLGSRIVYASGPDGVTIELIQPPD